MANYWNHSEIRIVDDHNDDKEHGWKRVDGIMFYAQYISGTNVYMGKEHEHPNTAWKDGWYELSRWGQSEDTHGYYRYYERAVQNVLEAGDETSVHRNQGEREAIVLAVDPERGEALIEYEMPAGTTALSVISWQGDSPGPSVSYATVSKAWIRRMHQQGTKDWQGRCQRRSGQWATYCRNRGHYDYRDLPDCYPFPPCPDA